MTCCCVSEDKKDRTGLMLGRDSIQSMLARVNASMRGYDNARSRVNNSDTDIQAHYHEQQHMIIKTHDDEKTHHARKNTHSKHNTSYPTSHCMHMTCKRTVHQDVVSQMFYITFKFRAVDSLSDNRLITNFQHVNVSRCFMHVLMYHITSAHCNREEFFI